MAQVFAKLFRVANLAAGGGNRQRRFGHPAIIQGKMTILPPNDKGGTNVPPLAYLLDRIGQPAGRRTGVEVSISAVNARSAL
jgi:hypothetical protein